MAETTKLSRETMISHSDDQVSCEVDGVAVLMSVENGEYYKLDDIGSRIWALSEKPMAFGSLCDALTAEFEVSAEQCEADVTKLMEKMLERKLVVANANG